MANNQSKSTKTAETTATVKKTIEERVSNILSSLQLEGNERSVASSLQRGDIFGLVGMQKYDMPQTNSGTKFVPIVFTTNKGANIGAKQFVSLADTPDEMPKIGTTPRENAVFLVWCTDHNVTFKVKSVKTEVVNEGKENEYTKKMFSLLVEDYELEYE